MGLGVGFLAPEGEREGEEWRGQSDTHFNEHLLGCGFSPLADEALEPSVALLLSSDLAPSGFSPLGRTERLTSGVPADPDAVNFLTESLTLETVRLKRDSGYSK